MMDPPADSAQRVPSPLLVTSPLFEQAGTQGEVDAAWTTHRPPLQPTPTEPARAAAQTGPSSLVPAPPSAAVVGRRGMSLPTSPLLAPKKLGGSVAEAAPQDDRGPPPARGGPARVGPGISPPQAPRPRPRPSVVGIDGVGQFPISASIATGGVARGGLVGASRRFSAVPTASDARWWFFDGEATTRAGGGGDLRVSNQSGRLHTSQGQRPTSASPDGGGLGLFLPPAVLLSPGAERPSAAYRPSVRGSRAAPLLPKDLITAGAAGGGPPGRVEARSQSASPGLVEGLLARAQGVPNALLRSLSRASHQHRVAPLFSRGSWARLSAAGGGDAGGLGGAADARGEPGVAASDASVVHGGAGAGSPSAMSAGFRTGSDLSALAPQSALKGGKQGGAAGADRLQKKKSARFRASVITANGGGGGGAGSEDDDNLHRSNTMNGDRARCAPRHCLSSKSASSQASPPSHSRSPTQPPTRWPPAPPHDRPQLHSTHSALNMNGGASSKSLNHRPPAPPSRALSRRASRLVSRRIARFGESVTRRFRLRKTGAREEVTRAQELWDVVRKARRPASRHITLGRSARASVLIHVCSHLEHRCHAPVEAKQTQQGAAANACLTARVCTRAGRAGELRPRRSARSFRAGVRIPRRSSQLCQQGPDKVRPPARPVIHFQSWALWCQSSLTISEHHRKSSATSAINAAPPPRRRGWRRPPLTSLAASSCIMSPSLFHLIRYVLMWKSARVSYIRARLRGEWFPELVEAKPRCGGAPSASCMYSITHPTAMGARASATRDMSMHRVRSWRVS